VLLPRVASAESVVRQTGQELCSLRWVFNRVRFILKDTLASFEYMLDETCDRKLAVESHQC